MPQPARKKPRTKTTPKDDEKEQQSTVLTDYRTSWLIKSDDQMVELRAKSEVFHVAKSVLTKNSEYFEKCLSGSFIEAKQGIVDFSNDPKIESRYLALYIGLAYSHSSIAPHTPPRPAESPETMAARTPIRDYIEVYKLCNFFVSDTMGEFMMRCLDVAMYDGHRALYRTESDEGMQKLLMRDFADGYEVLNMEQHRQSEMGEKMVYFFCGGVSFKAWMDNVAELMDRPRFVAAVSSGFAMKLRELESRYKGTKRKELSGPEGI